MSAGDATAVALRDERRAMIPLASPKALAASDKGI